MTTYVTIVDQNAPGANPRTATVPVTQVAATIAPWFPDASDSVSDAIAELQQCLYAHRCPDGLAAFLGLEIQPASGPPGPVMITAAD
ncbi:MAG: hypothetical protein ACRDT5_22865 [Mycobacterium sp.]